MGFNSGFKGLRNTSEKHVCRGFVVLDDVADRQLQQWRYRRKTRTQNAYRCILHGKTACLQLLLTAQLSQDERTALSAISRATGDVCDHMNMDTPRRFPHHSTIAVTPTIVLTRKYP